MTKKVNINGIITFILFLEEFIFWNPRYTNTIAEKIFLSLPLEFLSRAEIRTFASFIKPALFILIFLISYSSIVKFVTSFIGEHAQAEILIWLERNNYIKVILIVFLVIFMVFFVVKPIVDSSNFSLLSVYHDKTLWAIFFGYLIVKQLISEDLY